MCPRRDEAVEIVRPDGVAEGSVLSIFRVPPEVAGQRLDVFLAERSCKRTSRTRTQYIVKVSAYDVRGKRLRSNHRVQTEEHVLLWRAPWDEEQVPTDVPIVFEDEHILAVDKPAGLPVHPSARYHKNTLINVLKALRPGQFLLARSSHRSRDERRTRLRREVDGRGRSRAQEGDRVA